MIFVDSNIPMYLVGGPHPLREKARRTLESLAGRGESLVTSVEVLQEILHRYASIHRRKAIHPAFSALLDLVDEVIPVTLEDVLQARDVMFSVSALSPRDALHIAVMNRRGISRILSFDRDFNSAPGIERLPADD